MANFANMMTIEHQSVAQKLIEIFHFREFITPVKICTGIKIFRFGLIQAKHIRGPYLAKMGNEVVPVQIGIRILKKIFCT